MLEKNSPRKLISRRNMQPNTLQDGETKVNFMLHTRKKHVGSETGSGSEKILSDPQHCWKCQVNISAL